MTEVLEMENFAATADCTVKISRDVAMNDSQVNAPQGPSGSAMLPTQLFMVLMVSLLFINFVSVC
jgi:hypothetical protein